jgi:uncharacterized FlaG/YvyC family protein
MEIGAAIGQGAPVPDSVRAGRPAAPVNAPEPATSAPPSANTSQDVVDAIAAQAAAKKGNGARIRLDESTDRLVVQIVNADNEVIKQLPPEDLLRALERFREVTGLIFDRQA